MEFPSRCRGVAAVIGDGAARHCPGARWRRHRRSRRIRGIDTQARRSACPVSDNLDVTGGQFRRRQNRDQFELRQESSRSVPPAVPCPLRSIGSGYAAEAGVSFRLRGGREIRIARRCGLLPMARDKRRAALQGRSHLASGSGSEFLQDESGNCRCRRDRARAEGAAESRPHVLPRVGGGHGVFGTTSAWRGRGDRLLLGIRGIASPRLLQSCGFRTDPVSFLQVGNGSPHRGHTRRTAVRGQAD